MRRRFHGVPAPNAALRGQVVPSEPNERAAGGEGSSASKQPRLSWDQLLKSVFEIEVTTCSHCGSSVTLIATIEEAAVIIKIIAHLGLPTTAPPRSPAQAYSLLRAD